MSHLLRPLGLSLLLMGVCTAQSLEPAGKEKIQKISAAGSKAIVTNSLPAVTADMPDAMLGLLAQPAHDTLVQITTQHQTPRLGMAQGANGSYWLQSNSDGPIRHLFTVMVASKAPESARMVADLLYAINSNAKLYVLVLGRDANQARKNLNYLLVHDPFPPHPVPNWQHRVSFTELNKDATLWLNAFFSRQRSPGPTCPCPLSGL